MAYNSRDEGGLRGEQEGGAIVCCVAQSFSRPPRHSKGNGREAISGLTLAVTKTLAEVSEREFDSRPRSLRGVCSVAARPQNDHSAKCGWWRLVCHHCL